MNLSITSLKAKAVWRERLSAWTDTEWLRQHEGQVMLVLTLIIGAVVGLVITAFIYVTENLGSRMYPPGSSAAWRRLVIPVAGALISGYLLSRYFPNARGSGVPQTKAALFLRDGFIRFRTVVGKFGCCSMSLASGIALGREGPSVQVGAGIASVFGQRLGLGPERIRELVPIGSAAALAAAFNTPVAAVLFTLEEVMGDLQAPVLGSIVLSSATSWIVLHLLLGDEPLFHVPAYQLINPIEFLFYAVLGIVGGAVSVCFVKLLLYIRKRFMAYPRWTEWMQPGAGGLIVGVMGWFVPQVLGVGYANVSLALNGQMALGLMALLVPLKLVATASCYGSGNAGGIFGPALFIGAMMGGAFGGVTHHFLPDSTGSAGAYALVGMGVAFAGIVRVPLTSVIMIFEMTRDYSIIVPLMISNLVSFFISYRFQEEPIYEALQRQDHLHLPSGLRQRRGMLLVRAALIPARQTFQASDKVEDIIGSLHNEQNAWPVLDGSRLLGIVPLSELQRAMAEGRGHLEVGEVVPEFESDEELTADVFPHVHPDHPLDLALRRMAQLKVNTLPVVSRSDVRELTGTISIESVLRAYGIGDGQQETVPAAAQEAARSAPRFFSGLVAATLGALLLIGFLHHYYGAQRAARAETYFKAGNDLAAHGLNPEAIESYRNALSVAPGNRDYRLALGLTLQKAGQLDEASIYLQELLKTEPNNGPANLGMARIEAQQGKTAEAITSYHRAIYGSWTSGKEAERSEARFELADFLNKNGMKTQALAELSAALERAGNDDAARRRIARLILAYGSPEQAAGVFREILHRNNQDAEAYAGLGAAEFAQGNYVAAQSAYRSSVRLNPADEGSRAELDLSSQILALDPSAPGLRAAERRRRSKAMLEAVLGEAEACLSNITKPDDALAHRESLENARTTLARQSNGRITDDQAEADLSLAGKLWSETRAGCPASSEKDQAIARVLDRIAEK
jgi:chloride channel protein, CIC family